MRAPLWILVVLIFSTLAYRLLPKEQVTKNIEINKPKPNSRKTDEYLEEKKSASQLIELGRYIEAASLVEDEYRKNPEDPKAILAMSWKLSEFENKPDRALDLLLSKLESTDSYEREDFIFAIGDIIDTYGVSAKSVFNYYTEENIPEDLLLVASKALIENGKLEAANIYQKRFLEFQLKQGQSYRYVKVYADLASQYLEENQVDQALSAYREARDFYRIYRELIEEDYDVEFARSYIALLEELGLYSEIRSYKRQLSEFYPNDKVHDYIDSPYF